MVVIVKRLIEKIAYAKRTKYRNRMEMVTERVHLGKQERNLIKPLQFIKNTSVICWVCLPNCFS